LILIKIRWKIR